MTLDKEEKIQLFLIENLIPSKEFFRTIKEEDIQKLTENIKIKGQLEPIVVRFLDNNRFEIIDGHVIVEICKRLNKKEVKARICYIDEEEGYERALIINLCRTDLSSIDHENMIYTRFTNGQKSGRYKNITDFAKKIGYSDRQASDLIKAKKDRQDIFGEAPSDHVSTETLRAIKILNLDEKRKFCDRVKDGKIKASETREVMELFKDEKTTIELKEMILDGDEDWRTIKRFIETTTPTVNKLDRGLREYYLKKTVNKFKEEETPQYSPIPFQKLLSFVTEIEPLYYEKLIDKDKLIVDNCINITIALLLRFLKIIGKLNNDFYTKILKDLGYNPELIEHHKIDGQNPFLPSELKNENEKYLEKLNKKLKNEKQELFKNLR